MPCGPSDKGHCRLTEFGLVMHKAGSRAMEVRLPLALFNLKRTETLLKIIVSGHNTIQDVNKFLNAE